MFNKQCLINIVYISDESWSLGYAQTVSIATREHNQIHSVTFMRRCLHTWTNCSSHIKNRNFIKCFCLQIRRKRKQKLIRVLLVLSAKKIGTNSSTRRRIEVWHLATLKRSTFRIPELRLRSYDGTCESNTVPLWFQTEQTSKSFSLLVNADKKEMIVIDQIVGQHFVSKL